jgi:PAS domain S-box-containing protein
MSEARDPISALQRELTPTLQEALERAQALADRLEDAAAAKYAEELVDAINELKETRQNLLERAAYFERLMGEERRRYHDLFDRAPDAYVVTSLAGIILEANAATSQLFERQPANLLGKPLPVFVAPDSRPEFRRTLLRLSRQAVGMFELELETRSGRKHLEARASAELEDGRAPQLRWIMRDVTARKVAEAESKSLNAELERRIDERTRALTETYAQLETVLQEMPQGVVIVDMSGNVLMANRRAEELTGKTAAELGNIVEHAPWRMYGRDGLELDHDERPIVRALASGEPVPYERIRVVRADGTALVLDLAATPVRSSTGIVTVLNTFQDVTSREARERAERDFVTNAAHELQTPIAAITSGIQVLQAGAKDVEADRDRFLAHIEAACARLERLTRALLVLARAQAGDEPPPAELVEVAPLLRAVAQVLPPGTEVDVSCPPDVAVIANRPLLEQALVNLGANAVKYTTGRVRLAAATSNGRVRLEVRDEGAGIDPAERARVFDRFYRGGDQRDGFGLGLAIVAEAVRAIDGKLELDSSAEGTGVSISLPAATIVNR